MPAPASRPTSAADLLTADQVAELLAVTPRTVWRLAADGVLVPLHIRRAARWLRGEVTSYLARLARRRHRAVVKATPTNEIKELHRA